MQGILIAVFFPLNSPRLYQSYIGITFNLNTKLNHAHIISPSSRL